MVYFLRGFPKDQLIASILFTIAALTDWYDGWFARRFGVITRWGQFMDPFADKLLVSSALLLFAWMNIVKWWMVWVIVSRDVIVTIVRIYAIKRGTHIITHGVAKWKTFLQMLTIFMILLYINYLNFYGSGSSAYHAKYLDPIGLFMSIVTLLTIISAIIYFFENRRLITRMTKELFSFPFR